MNEISMVDCVFNMVRARQHPAYSTTGADNCITCLEPLHTMDTSNVTTITYIRRQVHDSWDSGNMTTWFESIHFGLTIYLVSISILTTTTPF
ncbi:unnamed protein product [Absidia cylindrospora]